MILTTHLITGAALASKIPSLSIAFILAFFSHYLLDFLPHYEYSVENIEEKRWKKSYLDFLKVFLDICFGFSVIFFIKDNLAIFAAAFLAILPDGISFISLIFPKSKLLKRYADFHQDKIHFHRNKKNLPFLKVFCELSVIFTAILFLQ